MQEKEPKERDVLRAFSLVLREWRIEAGLSQEQLANEGGLNRSHVSALENGGIDPKLTTLFRIARILGVRLWVLIRDMELVCDGDGENHRGDNKP